MSVRKVPAAVDEDHVLLITHLDGLGAEFLDEDDVQSPRLIKVAATQEAPDLPAWTEPPAQPPTNGWAVLLSVLVVGLVLGIIAVGALCGTCGEGWECAHLFQKAEEEIQRVREGK